MSRVASSLFFGVGPGDAFVFTSAAAAMVALAVIAVAVPARRAMRVDPIVALRSE